MSSTDRSPEDIRRGLEALNRKRRPTGVTVMISEVEQIQTGWENEVHSFRVEEGSAVSDAILRIYPGADANVKAEREFEAMQRLHESGYPVPRMIDLEIAESPFGAPCVVMERIPGRPLNEVFEDAPPNRRYELLALCCACFVTLHRLDWRPFAPDLAASGATSAEVARRHIERTGDWIREMCGSVFDGALLWLNERVGTVRWDQLSVTHGDYHGGNILVRPDGSLCIIDWGNVRVADRRFDVAWTLLLSSTFGTPELRDAIVAEYERQSGGEMEDLDFFLVFACLRRLSDFYSSVTRGARGVGMREEAVALMHANIDHFRQVYALLRELTGLRAEALEPLLM